MSTTVTSTDITSNGFLLAPAATDKAALYGGPNAPIAQQVMPTAVSTSAITAVATTAATNSSPYGYAQAQADAIVTAINLIITRQAELITAVNDINTKLANINTWA